MLVIGGRKKPWLPTFEIGWLIGESLTLVSPTCAGLVITIK